MIKTKAKLLKDYQDKLSSLKFLDPAAGFRVIIMTQANSHDGYMNFIDSTKF